MKKISLMLFVLCTISFLPALSQAAETANSAQTSVSAQVCPVSGDPAKAKLGYTYKGKEYHFCCKGCLRKFKKNPEKFLN